MKNLTVGESVPGLSSLTYLKGNHLSARQVFFTGFHSGSLKIITHDWKSCSCVLNFPFPLFFFFFPPLPLNFWSWAAKRWELLVSRRHGRFSNGFHVFWNSLHLADLFSRNSWIPPLFLFAVMKTRFAALGEGRGAEESEAGKQKMNLFWLYLYFILPS